MRAFCFTPILLLGAALATPVVAGADAVSSSRRTAIVTAIEKVSPAVVTLNVVAYERERVIDRDFWGLFGPRFFTRSRPVEGIGTGFIFDPRGYILTNYHVIQGADAITSVSLPGGRQLEVEFIGADERADLAVLKASGDRLPHVKLGTSKDLMIGEWVIAIGNPFGTMMADQQPSVSVGVISANHRRVSRSVGGGERLYQDLIQTDAAINPGNSGGPLVNAAGDVVGVNTMIFSSSGGHQGLGFAIPADRARRVAEELIEFGRRRNPWIGIHGEAVADLSPPAIRQFGLKATRGVLVTEIYRNAPAFRAGLELGDVIQKMNGIPVAHPSEMDFINWDLFIGDDVTLEVDRYGAPRTIRFKVEELDR
ncbi:MAG: trypsin-like peptidase domain-containing protein [Candidatus Hydrogenedentes bacterium]|nr:trypsin-like peptidase domain-containing protein [Candidatus Hydrogenedentota bacterium]